MNNFNNVFLAVREYCDQVAHSADEDCFKTIATAANVPYDKLDLYLDSLQDMKFITFSYPDNKVNITESGRKRQKLFT